MQDMHRYAILRTRTALRQTRGMRTRKMPSTRHNGLASSEPIRRAIGLAGGPLACRRPAPYRALEFPTVLSSL
jgi:hypothetical protein